MCIHTLCNIPYLGNFNNNHINWKKVENKFKNCEMTIGISLDLHPSSHNENN
jgi:hypothetical protein